MSGLAELKKHSIVVADTADFGLIKEFTPQDATTNPSLVLAGSKLPQYAPLVDSAIAWGVANGGETADGQVEAAIDKLTVAFGCEILKIVPGRVSSEVDAKLSFNTEASITKARRIVGLYKEAGFGPDRLYIKMASTWEGIQAARILEADGVQCNMTLLFSFAQALACAQARVTLISPFVGRIMDWFKKAEGKDYSADASTDPGVVSVTRIFNYYKLHGYNTIVMGASFRNVGEITHLSGCDKITIAPKLLEELAALPASAVGLALDKANPKPSVAGDETKKPDLTHSDFLFNHNEDPMGAEKLAEGIRNFNKDTRTLESVIRAKMGH